MTLVASSNSSGYSSDDEDNVKQAIVKTANPACGSDDDEKAAASTDAGFSSDDDDTNQTGAEITPTSASNGHGIYMSRRGGGSRGGFSVTAKVLSQKQTPRPVICHRSDSAVVAMMTGLQERFKSLDSLLPEEYDPSLADSSSSPGMDYVRLMTPSQFNSFLKYYGVDVDAVSKGNCKSLHDLWVEVVWRTSSLQTIPDSDAPRGFRIQRFVKLLVVELQAEIDGSSHFLVLTSEGHRQNLNQRLTEKMSDDEHDVEEAFGRCMLHNFGVAEAISWEHMEIIDALHHDELRESAGFPGLTTKYEMHTLHIRVRDGPSSNLRIIGFPQGHEFQTEKCCGFVGSKQRAWKWVDPESFEDMKRKSRGTIVSDEKHDILNITRLSVSTRAGYNLLSDSHHVPFPSINYRRRAA